MLSAQSRQDAEDVLQDVFVRAFGALRADERPVNVRAWLYRVAHNRCIDHLRRPVPAPADVFQMSRTPLHDPVEDAQRREDLRRLVADVGRLPEQQRSALLMREIDGMSYADLATALDVTVPAVKSLLVRARVGLVEAAEARSMDCATIRADLAASYDRGVKASGRARRHMRECSGCRDYRTALRSVRSSFAALSPGVGGIAAMAAKLFGLGGGGAAAGGAAASGGGLATGGAVAVGGATACKVAAVVCTAALTVGGAAEVGHIAAKPAPARQHAAASAAAAAVHPNRIMRPAPLTSPRPPGPRPRRAPRPASGAVPRPTARGRPPPPPASAPPSATRPPRRCPCGAAGPRTGPTTPSSPRPPSRSTRPAARPTPPRSPLTTRSSTRAAPAFPTSRPAHRHWS